MSRGTGWRYAPANTLADLSPAAREQGRKSMAEFLLSPQIAAPVMAATADIRDAAQHLAEVEAYDTGAFSRGFDVEAGEPIVIDGNPRVSGRVVNSDPAAAPLEFGNVHTPPRRILGRAGAPWHSEKKPL